MGKNVLKVVDNALSLLPRVVLEAEGTVSQYAKRTRIIYRQYHNKRFKKNSRYRNCTPSNGIGNGNGNGNANTNANANINASGNGSGNGSGKVLIFCRNIPFL